MQCKVLVLGLIKFCIVFEILSQTGYYATVRSSTVDDLGCGRGLDCHDLRVLILQATNVEVPFYCEIR